VYTTFILHITERRRQSKKKWHRIQRCESSSHWSRNTLQGVGTLYYGRTACSNSTSPPLQTLAMRHTTHRSTYKHSSTGEHSSVNGDLTYEMDVIWHWAYSMKRNSLTTERHGWGATTSASY